MVQIIQSQMTAEEFFNSPFSGERYELKNGEAIPKVAPQRFHASLQMALLYLLGDWSLGKGDLLPEWSVKLQRNQRDWVPIPDLTYVSYDRLEPNWKEDGPCPIPPDLAIEIISPGQTFGELVEKASDYLSAGVLRVWLVDAQAQTITVFAPQAVPATYRDELPIVDALFPELKLTVQQVFKKANLRHNSS